MAAVEELATGELQEQARKHLWMHFTRMGSFDADHEIPIIVRGEGCYVYDQHGRRYLDGLSALYCVTPAGYFDKVREICDEHGILFISDEVICSWGRLGEYFGAERFGYEPDIITTAKGLTSSYAPMGAVIASAKVFEPFAQGSSSFAHGITFGGHPVAAATVLANLDVFERESLLDNVRDNEATFGAMLDSLRDIPIVGDVRGMGYFWALELVQDRATKQTFSEEECEWLVRDFLSAEIFKHGLICRADDRGDPVIQLAPPLIAGPEQFEEIRSVLRPALEEASRRLDLH